MKLTVQIKVPEWAKWMAQDEDGKWWFFEAKPFVDVCDSVWVISEGTFQLAYQDESPINWELELWELY
jgi:hypothetical protein